MIGLLELRRRPLQFGLITVVVTLISYLVLMINGLGVGLNVLAGGALRNLEADSLAYSSEAGLSVLRSELSTATVEAITAANGELAAAPLGYVAANYRGDSGDVDSAAFLGYAPGTIGEPSVTAGRALAPGDGDGMLADSSFLRAGGFELGDEVEVTVRLATRRFRIVGEIGEGAFFFQPAVYVLLDSWRDLKYAAGEGERPAASIVLLKGRSQLGKHEGYEVVDKGTAFDNIEGVQGQQATVQALRAFGFLIGGLVIAVFFYVITLQKVPQVGVLKAIGASSSYVFRQVVIQVLAITAGAVAASVPMAWLTDRALASRSEAIPIAFTGGTYLFTIAGLFVTALLGALICGRQVSRVDPIIALGQQQ